MRLDYKNIIIKHYLLHIVKRRAVVGTNDELKSAVLCSRRHARVGNGAFSAA